MANPIVKVKGIALVLGGTTMIVPPLSLGALEQLQERIGKVTDGADGTDIEQIATVIDAAHAALRRNYPEITREEVGELIDLENMAEVFMSVMDVSGLKRKEREKAEAGE